MDEAMANRLNNQDEIKIKTNHLKSMLDSLGLDDDKKRAEFIKYMRFILKYNNREDTKWIVYGR